MDRNELLLAWLRDAHAMEESLIPIRDTLVKNAAMATT